MPGGDRAPNLAGMGVERLSFPIKKQAERRAAVRARRLKSHGRLSAADRPARRRVSMRARGSALRIGDGAVDWAPFADDGEALDFAGETADLVLAPEPWEGDC